MIWLTDPQILYQKYGIKNVVTKIENELEVYPQPLARRTEIDRHLLWQVYLTYEKKDFWESNDLPLLRGVLGYL